METDVVVVGGGHNGLTCAAYLARAGEHVIVLERRDVLGGCGTSEPTIAELPEFTFNPGAFDLLGITETPMFKDLELEKFGLELLPVDPMFQMPYPDGRHLLLWRSVDRTVEGIGRLSKADAGNYLRYVEFWSQVLELMDPINAGAPPPFTAMASAMEGAPEAEEFLRIMMMPARQYIRENFETSHLQGLMAFFALQTKTTLSEPGSVLAMTELVASHAAGVWRPRGGVGMVSAAIARALEAAGGTILRNAHVSQILVQGGQAAGVRLGSGETIGARKAVVTAISPQRVFLELIDEAELDPKFRRQVAHLQNDNTSVIKGYYALEEPPVFSLCGDDGSRPEFRTASAMVCPSLEYSEAMWDDVKHGRLPEHPWLWCTLSTGLDPTMAPPGKHCLGLHCWVPYELANSRDWDDVKEEMAMRMFQEYCLYAPNLKGKLLGWAARGPKDWEHITDNPKGNNFHVDMVPHQILGFRPLPELSGYRAPIAGLYLTGAGMHPGPAITGLPGHNTAQVVLRDLGKAPEQD